VRDLSYLLHPAALDELGLPAAVDSFLKRFAKRSGIDVTLTHRGMEQRLSPEIETAAYRIVQEALTNVARHSGATNCSVEIVHVNGMLKVSIEDNGQGFDAGVLASRGQGLGLIGIRERAFQLHGTALLDSRPGAGTRLVVEVPARRRAEQDEFETMPDPTAA
jgi:two-component system sensor kinase